MNKKEYIFTLTAVVLFLAIASSCLFFDSVLKDTINSYIATSESLNAVKDKIISNDLALTDEQILMLFSNSEDDSKSVQELINSISEFIRALAHLIIIIAILQGYTIIKSYRNTKGQPKNV